MTTPADQPYVVSWRAARGLPPAPPTAGLEAAGRTLDAAWVDWQSAVAHAVVGYRPTCKGAAAFWARVRLTEWLAELSDEELDGWADALVAEARAVAERRGAAA